MSLLEIVLIGIGLGMDAFSVSICKGLQMNKINWKNELRIGAYFGIFQGIMPIIGFLIGGNLKEIISGISKSISIIVLLIIGIKMILDSRKDEVKEIENSIDFKSMLLLSVATSIDALAVGVSLAFITEKIIKCSIIIGIVTFLMSAFGMKIGHKIGNKIQNNAGMLGGIILISISIKMLIM